MMTFSIIDRDGRVVHADPRLAAYSYIAMLQVQERFYSLTQVVPGEYIVTSPGLMTLTFVKLED